MARLREVYAFVMAERRLILVTLLRIALQLGPMIALSYIAAHFIVKYW